MNNEFKQPVDKAKINAMNKDFITKIGSETEISYRFFKFLGLGSLFLFLGLFANIHILQSFLPWDMIVSIIDVSFKVWLAAMGIILGYGNLLQVRRNEFNRMYYETIKNLDSLSEKIINEISGSIKNNEKLKFYIDRMEKNVVDLEINNSMLARASVHFYREEMMNYKRLIDLDE